MRQRMPWRSRRQWHEATPGMQTVRAAHPVRQSAGDVGMRRHTTCCKRGLPVQTRRGYAASRGKLHDLLHVWFAR